MSTNRNVWYLRLRCCVYLQCFSCHVAALVRYALRVGIAIWRPGRLAWHCHATWRPAAQMHDVQFSCAINQPLLAHHWRVHQCLFTSRFIAPSIPWGVSAPGGKMLKQLLKDHNFLNNSPIFIIESSTFDIFAFQKALHTIHFNLKSCFGFGERYLTP